MDLIKTEADLNPLLEELEVNKDNPLEAYSKQATRKYCLKLLKNGSYARGVMELIANTYFDAVYDTFRDFQKFHSGSLKSKFSTSIQNALIKEGA